MSEVIYKRANYKTTRDSSPVQTKRSEWYRCSAGLTIGSRMTAEGEILHISELDTEVTDPNNPTSTYKAETFTPISLPEQERRFGRIMYMAYDPSDEELAQLGWQRVGVTADEVATQSQMNEQHAEQFASELDAMGRPQLIEEARTRFGISFPLNTSTSKMRETLLDYYNDPDTARTEEVTEQMVANIAQRVPTEASTAVASDIAAKTEVDEEETKEQKVERRKQRAAAKLAAKQGEDNG